MTFFGGWGDIHMLCKYHISVYGYHKGTKFNPLLFNDVKPWLSNHASSSYIRIKNDASCFLSSAPHVLSYDHARTFQFFFIGNITKIKRAKYIHKTKQYKVTRGKINILEHIQKNKFIINLYDKFIIRSSFAPKLNTTFRVK